MVDNHLEHIYILNQAWTSKLSDDWDTKKSMSLTFMIERYVATEFFTLGEPSHGLEREHVSRIPVCSGCKQRVN